MSQARLGTNPAAGEVRLAANEKELIGMPDFIPRSDQELLSWSHVFGLGIAKDPGRFGLDLEQSQAYRRLHDDLARFMEIASAPVTRTPVTIAQKDAARTELVR